MAWSRSRSWAGAKDRVRQGDKGMKEPLGLFHEGLGCSLTEPDFVAVASWERHPEVRLRTRVIRAEGPQSLRK